MPSLATLTLLHAQVRAVCPIEGVSIGSWADRQTWRIDFLATATPTQRAAAQQVLTAFDPDTADTRSVLAMALDGAIEAVPSIDPRIKAVFVEWRKQIS